MPTKKWWRLIRDGSHSRGFKQSINDGIPDDAATVQLDNIKEYASLLINGSCGFGDGYGEAINISDIDSVLDSDGIVNISNEEIIDSFDNNLDDILIEENVGIINYDNCIQDNYNIINDECSVIDELECIDNIIDNGDSTIDSHGIDEFDTFNDDLCGINLESDIDINIINQHMVNIDDKPFYGGYCGGFDLSTAFRQIHVPLDDANLLGYSICGLKFIDYRHPWGTRVAGSACQKATSTALWIFKNIILPKEYPQWHYQITCNVYFDDITICGPTYQKTKDALSLAIKTFDELGLHRNPKKDINPSQKVQVFGLDWDLIKMKVKIPKEKLDDIIVLIDLCLSNDYMSIAIAFRLAGLINYYARLNKIGKILSNGIIREIYTATGGYNGKYTAWLKSSWILKISSDIKDDLKLFKHYFSEPQDYCMYNIIGVKKITNVLFTDATLTHGGYCSDMGYYSHFDIPQSLITNNEFAIHIAELYALYLAILNNGKEFANKCFKIYIDNQAVVAAILNCWSKHRLFIKLIWSTLILLRKYHIYAYYEWISTDYNLLADALSRNKLTDFISMYPFLIPPNYVDCFHNLNFEL